MRSFPLLFAVAAAWAGVTRGQDPAAAAISRIESPQSPNRGGLDALTVTEIMRKFHVPGVSVAVIQDFKIAWAKGYGTMDANSDRPVDTHTLFQAASISKPVTATAVMTLVQAGKLHLDHDVNEAEHSWRVPQIGPAPVTLRSLLSHTSGADDGYGFPGYAPNLPRPTVVQILQGNPLANRGPVPFTRPPYQAYKYSGGGLLIVQLAVTDTARRPFAQVMHDAVLSPLGMNDSTYEQPLPAAQTAHAALAHSAAGERMNAPWHVFPEQAAAGLWTTASDLARVVIEVQTALDSNTGKILSQASAREMTAPVGVGPTAVGLMVAQRGEGWYFSHSGSNWGFTCDLVGHLRKGYGIVVMTNSDRGSPVYGEIEARVAAAYNWDSLDKPLLR